MFHFSPTGLEGSEWSGKEWLRESVNERKDMAMRLVWPPSVQDNYSNQIHCKLVTIMLLVRFSEVTSHANQKVVNLMCLQI